MKKEHEKKIIGSILSSIFCSLLFIFPIAIVIYAQLTEEEKMPLIIFWFTILLLVIPIVGIIMNLILRIREIKGGEEDEASKY